VGSITGSGIFGLPRNMAAGAAPSFDLSVSGAALVMELLAEIDDLRAQLRCR
jgi:hypothetical protein